MKGIDKATQARTLHGMRRRKHPGSHPHQRTNAAEVTAPKRTTETIIDQFLDTYLPKDDNCVVIVEHIGRNWHPLGGYDNQRHSEPLLRCRQEIPLTHHWPELDRRLSNLTRAIDTFADLTISVIETTALSPLTAKLTDRGVNWLLSRDDDTASAILHMPELHNALSADLDNLKTELRHHSSTLIPAVAGQSRVIQRDPWADNPLQHGFLARDLVVLDDRRLLQVDITAQLKRNGNLADGTIIDDLGTVRSIHIEDTTTTLVTSNTREKEVTIATDQGRQVVGYRTLPITLTLHDPVGPSVLMALVELGGGHMVTAANT